LGPGLDVRGSGGFVVLPSMESGYWWDTHWNFDTAAPALAPAWLGRRQRRKTPPTASTRPRRFNPEAILDEACGIIRNAGPGEKWRAIRSESFIAGTLVRDRHLPESRVRHEIEAAVFALKPYCNDFDHAIKGYEGAFTEALASRRAK
jgi:hypothetical protein